MTRQARDRRRPGPDSGWIPRLSGLDRPREWAGFGAAALAAVGVAMLIAFLAFG